MTLRQFLFSIPCAALSPLVIKDLKPQSEYDKAWENLISELPTREAMKKIDALQWKHWQEDCQSLESMIEPMRPIS